VGYLIKATLGLALFFGGIALFNVKLVSLLETGTCASGNQPFVVAQPCPEGTGTDIMLLTVAIFAGLIGAAIFAFRGDPPWGSRRRSAGLFGLGTLAWGLFFSSTGAVMLYTALANDTIGEDGELGGMIVGITFLVMGLPALLIALWSLVRGIGRGRDERPAALAGAGASPAGGVLGRFRAGMDQTQAAQALGARLPWGSGGSGSVASARSAGGDTIGRLERLQKLRESGAINDQEFAREKAKILAEQ
jgi:hypothetical protein